MNAKVIVQQMTDVQKEMVLKADSRDVACVVRKGGRDVFQGLLQVAKGAGMSSVVARTDLIYKDTEEAMDMIEMVLAEIHAEVEEVVPEAKNLKDEAEKILEASVKEGGANSIDNDEGSDAKGDA